MGRPGDLDEAAQWERENDCDAGIMLAAALSREKEWTAALVEDNGRLIERLDAVATALGIRGRTDATDLVGPIGRLRAEVERLGAEIEWLKAFAPKTEDRW